MKIEVCDTKLKTTKNLHVDDNTMGRLVVPQIMVKSIGITKSGLQKVTLICDMEARSITIKKGNGNGGGC